MKENISKNNEINLTKTILSAIGKTSLIVLSVVGFIFISISVIAPRVVAPLLTTIGCDNANYLLYKRMYEREKTNKNLYNVIQLAIENEKYEDQVFYINEMINDEDFADFAEIVDSETKKILGARYSIYADSYESYLRRHIVEALYRTNNGLEAKMMALDSVHGQGNIDELYAYVILVEEDENLLDIQKEAEFITLFKRYGLMDAIETKKTALDIELSLAGSSYDAIIIYEQKVKIADVEYYIGKYNDKELLKEAENNKKLYKSEIEKLLSNL